MGRILIRVAVGLVVLVAVAVAGLLFYIDGPEAGLDPLTQSLVD
jgi:hypothetical protein